MTDYPKSGAPVSRLPNNNEAALLQARMNIRILAMKHAMKLEAYYAHMNENGPNAVHVVAQAGIIEEYLSQGILSPESPATIGTGKTN